MSERIGRPRRRTGRFVPRSEAATLLRERAQAEIWAFLDDPLDTADRPQLVDELYRRMADRFAADPARYEFHFISLGVLLTRV